MKLTAAGQDAAGRWVGSWHAWEAYETDRDQKFVGGGEEGVAEARPVFRVRHG